MKCRALFSDGHRCINDATKSVGTGTAPQLCPAHYHEYQRHQSTRGLRLAPLNLRAAVEALFPNEKH